MPHATGGGGEGPLDLVIPGNTYVYQNFKAAPVLVKRKWAPKVHSGFCYKTVTEIQGVFFFLDLPHSLHQLDGQATHSQVKGAHRPLTRPEAP